MLITNININKQKDSNEEKDSYEGKGFMFQVRSDEGEDLNVSDVLKENVLK